MFRLFLLLFFLASVLFFRFATFYQSQPVYNAGDEVVLETVLHEEPDLSNKGQRFSIKTSINQIIFVQAEATPRLRYGDQITLSGIIEEKELATGGRLLVMYQPEITLRSEPRDILSDAALFIRRMSKELFEKTLPPTSASLLSGIVFGAKEHFPQEFKQSLSATGVLHVIAASGMNVAFIAAAFLSIGGIFLKRQFTLALACCGIVFYVFLVGFEASIVRAAIMGLLTFGAGILGRQQWAFFGLALTGYLMLLLQPSYLFDVGFQLSFMATLGILLMGGIGTFGGEVTLPSAESQRDVWKNTVAVFKESLLTTFAAQVATVPILLGVFGSIGVLGLLVNALVLWVVPIVMTIGSIAVLVGLAVPLLGQGIVYLSLPFLLFFEAAVSFFGSFGWNVSIEEWPWTFTVGYYLSLAAIVIYWKLKNKQIPQ